MECNRDEAVRAKEIAERKFLARDLKGAKKFAKKAQNLFPELDGISQMLMTLEVYISAEEEKTNGESNWYGVLGLTRMVDDATIKKQFKKLALLLHPDKNKCIGAEGAFQLVLQAFNLLSDKSKRIEYDLKCGASNPNTNQGPSTAKNGFHDFAKTAAASKMKVPKGNSSKRNHSSAPYSSNKKERQTFWTVCHRCKMQYEYLRMYLNHHLLCPNCHEAYFAMEIDPPSGKASKVSSQTMNSQHNQNTNQQGINASRKSSGTHYGTSEFYHGSAPQHNDFQWVPFSESNGAASAVHAANMVQQAYEKVKRERQKAQAAKRKEEAQRKKNQRTMGADSSIPSNAAKKRRGVEECCTTKPAMKLAKSESGKFQSTIIDIRQLMMEKARSVIRKSFTRSVPATVVGDSVGKSVGSIEHSTSDTCASMCHQNNLLETVVTTSQISLNTIKDWTSRLDLDSEQIEKMSVFVPDPEFYDFDKDRTGKCFGDNQIWAVYDDDDGMPRNYAMIHNVISVNPFEVRMSWLSPQNYSRLGHVSWLRCNFSKTCGEYGIGKIKTFRSLNCFSHKVRWSKSASETIQIFPQKRDIWALHRNWSPDWNELTDDEVIRKYDFVEVLEDYDEEQGIIVIPLVKVAGFRTVFHQHFDSLEIQRIPKEEMCRFSHQVPSHVLTRSKALKGCLELDPSAVPLEILQAVSSIKEIELMDTEDDVEEADSVETANAAANEVEGKAEEIESDQESDEEVEAVDGDGNTIVHMVEGVS